MEIRITRFFINKTDLVKFDCIVETGLQRIIFSIIDNQSVLFIKKKRNNFYFNTFRNKVGKYSAWYK